MGIRVHYNSAAGDVKPELINGDPPPDQQQQVIQLTADLVAANTTIAQFKAFRAAVVADAEARKAADAAHTEGQALLDAAQGLPQ